MILSRRRFIQSVSLGASGALIPSVAIGAGWVAAGCVVVGVGAVVTIWVIPFCKKHFGKTDDDKKDGDDGNQFVGNIFANPDGSGEDEMAALDCVHYKNDCGGGSEDISPFPSLLPGEEPKEESLGFNIDVTLTDRFGQFNIETKVSKRQPEVPMSFEEFQAYLRLRHGLNMTSGTGSQSSYGKNRQPATADQVPISFVRDGSSGSFPGVVVGRYSEQYTLALERSEDLIRWSRMTTLTTGLTGKPIRFVDTSNSDHAFYRARLVS